MQFYVDASEVNDLLAPVQAEQHVVDENHHEGPTAVAISPHSTKPVHRGNRGLRAGGRRKR